jgi:STE24 endopeptidase
MLALILLAQLQLAPPPAAASGASGSIDPVAATRAYLDTVPAEARAKSDAYFEGGYWLELISALWAAGVYLLLLQTGASRRMRDRAERWFRWKPLQTAYYWLDFLVATTVLFFPLSVYRGFVREHSYGLSNMTFGSWLLDELKGTAVAAALGALAAVALYGIVRRVRMWWLWGAAVSAAFIAVILVIGPVFLEPIFNTTKKLQDQRVVAPILSMARANGIQASEVWEIDESKQSKRVSAHVSGLLGTERISLNDNLLNRCSLEEIEAVMGHEMGHYVLNHGYKLLLEFGLLILIGFAAVSALFDRLRARFARWDVRGIGDVAGLPLVALLFTAYFFLVTPVANSITRTAEYEADIFGLNASRQPDGEAQVDLKLGEYRKLEPGRLEEIFFFDHPSGYVRILAAMRYKAEHPDTWKR